MKKTLLFTGILSLSIAASAQHSSNDQTAEYPRPGHAGIIDDDRASPFWTEDFGGGFPADWAVHDSSGLCPWVYTTDGSWGYWNGNNATAAADGITSTTNANGYLICDNDSANHFTYGQPSGDTYEYLSSWFTTSAIDCSTHPSVILRFEQFFRYNNSVDMWVQVSTDSSTWTSYEVSEGWADNTYSTDPDLVVLNISPVAASSPTVYLRFGWNARVYFWCIDDISLSEAEPNDLIMESGWWETGIMEAQWFKIPIDQASPITFRGEISNNTGSTLNDVYMDLDVVDGASVYSDASATDNLTSTEVDTFTVSTWTPAATGNFTANYTAEITGLTDGDLTNNDFSDDFAVTDFTYGLDNLNDPSEAGGSISNWSGNSGNQFGIGNLYEIMADDEIYCLEIGIDDAASNEGQLIYGAIYQWNGSEWEFLELTGDHTIEASDLGGIVTLPLDDVLSVSAGQQLLVLGCHYGGTDVSFMMGQPVPNQMVYGFDGSFTWYWLTSPRAVIARALFSNCGIGVEENTAENAFTAYPNPADNEVNLEFEMINSGNVAVSITDVMGRTIVSNEYGEYQAGKHLITLDTDKLNSGTYFVEIQLANKTMKEKVILRR